MTKYVYSFKVTAFQTDRNSWEIKNLGLHRVEIINKYRIPDFQLLQVEKCISRNAMKKIFRKFILFFQIYQ
jgi:hypothetical protein